MQPISEREVWCRVLEVSPNATEDEIRQAYRNLVTVWHPDRFEASNLKALAEEKLKEINLAYEALEKLGFRSASAETRPDPAPAPPPAYAVPSSRRWMPAAVVLATVLVIGAVFFFVAQSGSRSRTEVPPPTGAIQPGTPELPKTSKTRAPAKSEPDAEQPSTGLLQKAKPPFGEGRLIIENDTHLDAYARLMMTAPTKQQFRAIYIRSGESFTVTRLPLGQFTLYADVGKRWSTGSSSFEDDHQELDPVGPLAYVRVQTPNGVQSDTYTVALSAQDPKTTLRLPHFRIGGKK